MFFRPFPAEASPLSAPHSTSVQLLTGNCTAVESHDMRGEGGLWVWCMCAPCFNLSFENGELNCSTA